MKTFLMLPMLAVVTLLVGSSLSADWDYGPGEHGPQHWPNECVLPESTHQSPINIIRADATTMQYPEFVMRGYDNVDGVLVNTGHSVQFTLASSANAVLTGGGLTGTYKLAQFHFHWGSTDKKGSEHEINGRQYPMEVHFVHFNTKYGDIGTAASKSDGLAVLGWMFKVKSHNKRYEKVFAGLDTVKDPAAPEPYRIANLNVKQLMRGTGRKFYRYQGSLTTPPCYQSVTWTVFDKPVRISEEQMNKMRQVMSSEDHKMSNNFRPITPLNGRKVYTNKGRK